jgi:hypothetical protein
MDSSLVLVVFGSWFDHVTGWWERKQSHPKLHYMLFEDMVEVSSVQQEQQLLTRVCVPKAKGYSDL